MNKLYKKIVSLFLCVFFICSPLQLIFADTLEETENTDSKTTSNPKTGDNITIWIAIMAISGIGLLGTLKHFKKRD